MINREELLRRHAPHYTRPELAAPLSVGNGAFCFTADVTGLQSLAKEYGICPLCTMAEWGWHRYGDAPVDDSALKLEMFDTFGREVGYATRHEGQEELFYALRQSAHKANLARTGLLLDGKPISLEDVSGVDQTLSLWEGVLRSSFLLAGQPVSVTTLVHPAMDALCVRVCSPLLFAGRLTLHTSFPYGSHKMNGGDFNCPEKHKTLPCENEPGYLRLVREMDDFSCTVEAHASGVFALDGLHGFSLHADKDVVEYTLHFVKPGTETAAKTDGFSKQLTACQAFWQHYWQDGGALELTGSKDARELERRIVLSQYLLAIQSRGHLPPAETGLTINSWYGKFNVEMHCWHHAHFAFWGRADVVRQSLTWYKNALPVARDIARAQGYAGARWPKLCDGTGYNSPSSIAVLLIWQQPHPLMLLALCQLRSPSPELLQEYREVILETAEFMVDFAHFDGRRYILGAPYIPAQERFDPRGVLNAGYEVEYFRWGLRTAARFLSEIGETPNPKYLEVAERLPAPISYEGVYPAHENCPETYTQFPFNTDHPSMVAMLGLLPGEGVDRAIMNATLDRILKDWDLDSTWGWDFPMLAMTAARLGRRRDAVRFLLMDSPKNTYLPNGHNRQGDKEDLPLYLPGNGSLLLAAGMMAAGWAGADGVAPGFPRDDGFAVTVEGMEKYI